MKLTESTLRSMIRQEVKKSLNEAASPELETIISRLTAYSDTLKAKSEKGATQPDSDDVAEMAEILKMMTDGLKTGKFSVEDVESLMPPRPTRFTNVGTFGSRRVR